MFDRNYERNRLGEGDYDRIASTIASASGSTSGVNISAGYKGALAIVTS